MLPSDPQDNSSNPPPEPPSFQQSSTAAEALRAAGDDEEIVEIPSPFLLIPEAKKRAYLIAQTTTPSRKLACEVAGIDPKTEYNWRMHAQANPEEPANKAYLAALKVAMDMAVESAEHEAWHRAVHGWQEPVFGQISEPVEIEKADGKGTRIVFRNRTGVVGHLTKKSDVMLIFMLKGAKPETYRDRVEHSGPDGSPLQLQIVLPDNGRARRLPSGE